MLTSQAHDSSFLGILPPSFSDLQAPTTKITVLAKGTEYVVSSVHKESAEIAVADLGDVQLRVVLAGLILSWDQAKSRTDFTAFPETLRVFQGEDKGQGSEMSNTADFLKQLGFRIVNLTELLYLIVVGIDLLSKGSDMIQDGCERGKKILRDELMYLFMEAGRGAGWKTGASGFDHAAHMDDEQGASTYKDITRAEHSKMCLSFLALMKDRREKFGSRRARRARYSASTLSSLRGFL
jgi:hypothetical protein